MKKHLLLVLGISLLSFHPALGEDASQTVVTTPREASPLPRFDLDFPGGTPGELVKAIEKATGKPLNTIISDDFTNWGMHAFSVHNVTVAQLFEAYAATTKDTRLFPGGVIKSWTGGFRTEGVPNENSIWYFFNDRPGEPDKPEICRFYELSPYLEAGYKVEDITTAIETAWEMLGASPKDAADSLKYHKDTKLLIVKGNANDMKMIEEMLAQLSKAIPKRASSVGEDARNPKTR